MSLAAEILGEVTKQDKQRVQSSAKSLLDDVLKEIGQEADNVDVDILTYVRAPWGLNEDPYPIQRFMLKVINGIALDDRPDSEVIEVIDELTIRVERSNQFDSPAIVDVGQNKAIRVDAVDVANHTITFCAPPPIPLKVGDFITGRILTWDKFRENITGAFTESEFLTFLYGDGPGAENCRINVNLQEYEARVRAKKVMNLIILRIGRRGTKTTISQWMAAYNAYKVLRKYYPQQYYRTRRDQAISMTLIATGKEQAQDLLAPARSAMKRSPYLRRFVAADSERRLVLNTPYNMDNGLDAENGLKIIAAPCSAKSVRGPANILVLLEEYGMFYYELAGSNKSDMAIYEAISPSLADLTDPKTGEPAGTMMIISTPLTRESHMYKLEQQIWDNHADLGNSLVLHLPSYWTNRLLSTQKLRQEYAVDPLYFRQEFEAYYSDQRQLALKREEIEGCCQIAGPNDLYPHPGEQCFMGFDLGLKNDPTAIVIVAVNSEGHARVVHHETIAVRDEDLEYVDADVGDVLDIFKVAQRVDELWKAWRCRKGMGDQWTALGFRPLLKTDAKVNLEFTDINSTLNDRVARNFLAYVYQRNVTIYATKEDWENRFSLVRELARLQRVETSGMMQKIKIEAPNLQGAHDDMYSALSRALYCAQQAIIDMPPVVLTGKHLQGRAALIAQKRETLQRQQQQAAAQGRPTKGGRSIGRFKT